MGRVLGGFSSSPPTRTNCALAAPPWMQGRSTYDSCSGPWPLGLIPEPFNKVIFAAQMCLVLSRGMAKGEQNN